MTKKAFKKIKKEYLEDYEYIMERTGIVTEVLYETIVALSEHDQLVKCNIKTLTYDLNHIYDMFKENYALAEEAQNENELLLAVVKLNKISIAFDNLRDTVEALCAFSFSFSRFLPVGI